MTNYDKFVEIFDIYPGELWSMGLDNMTDWCAQEYNEITLPCDSCQEFDCYSCRYKYLRYRNDIR